MPDIKVHLIQNKNELDDMYYQRWLVLRAPLGMPRGTEKDKYDDSSIHLVAVCDRNVIGSARLRELSEELGSIAYVSVLPDFQNQGIGTKLIKELIEIAQKKKLRTLRVMTRMNALEFYKKLGFWEKDAPFQYLDIPHVFMYLNLPSPLNESGDFQLST